MRDMQSGHLTIDGTFSKPSGLYPLTGSAVIDDIVVKNSPVLGKLAAGDHTVRAGRCLARSRDGVFPCRRAISI